MFCVLYQDNAEPVDKDHESDNLDADSKDELKYNNANNKEDSDDEEDSLPDFLMKPPSHGLGELGQWEAHTKVTYAFFSSSRSFLLHMYTVITYFI